MYESKTYPSDKYVLTGIYATNNRIQQHIGMHVEICDDGCIRTYVKRGTPFQLIEKENSRYGNIG